MAVQIKEVARHSPAARAHIKAGWTLLSIGGHEITDVLDYEFYAAEERLDLVLLEGEKEHTVTLHKNQYEDLGLSFETYLMDKQHTCRNDCIFCFVSQMPPGMRESLYFKDDDARLSFLFGNYITLTNLSQREIDRIIEMKISPINISVHATNPELRVKLMKNRFAGKVLSIMRRFADAGIRMNCQLVLCPGINDGEELRRSLRDLRALAPAVQSIACVPVGVTKYRDGLPPLTIYNKETAGEAIDVINAEGDIYKEETGSRICYPADEFYVLAGRPIPDGEYYEEYDQLENGVGMLALFREEFMSAFESLEANEKATHCTVVTGQASYAFLRQLIDYAHEKWHNFHCDLVRIENDFFGKTITVTGLLTGTDIVAQLRGKELGDVLYIPVACLRHEQDKMLDDYTLEDIRRELGVPVELMENDGYTFLEKITGSDETWQSRSSPS